MRKQQILVVEDEKPLQDFYAGFFDKIHAGEFSWRLAKTGAEALDGITAAVPDIVLLDWVLPGLSGLTLLRALRGAPKTQGIGILMVTARSSADDAVAAFESGADDYLAKPFDERVLLARLRGVVGRKEGLSAARRFYELPGLSWDSESGSLNVSKRKVHLYPKESDLLKVFLGRPDRIHSTAFLWNLIWGYESENWQRILTSAVSSLRKKIGPSWGSRIESHSNKGYLFNSLDRS